MRAKVVKEITSDAKTGAYLIKDKDRIRFEAIYGSVRLSETRTRVEITTSRSATLTGVVTVYKPTRD